MTGVSALPIPDAFFKESVASEPRGNGACIEWPGSRDRDGYGRAWGCKPQAAHRLFYTMFVGPIPLGMCVLHRCDNPACVNPAHLWVGTQKDNALDRQRKGRGFPIHLHCPRHSIETVAAVIAASGDWRSECLRLGVSRTRYFAIRKAEREGVRV